MVNRSFSAIALRTLVLPAAAVMLFGACAGTGSPGAGTRPVSRTPAQQQGPPPLTPTRQPADLGDVERFAWQQVVLLGDAFASGNVDSFLAKVSNGFYRGYAGLELSLRKLLKSPGPRSAVVAVRSVELEDGRVSVRAEWTRSVTLPDGSTEARRGETVFLFLKSDTNLRLLDYRGDAPFAIPGI